MKIINSILCFLFVLTEATAQYSPPPDFDDFNPLNPIDSPIPGAGLMIAAGLAYGYYKKKETNS